MLFTTRSKNYDGCVRITSKGQVTIPQRIRDRYGLLPETDVEFVEVDGEVVIRRMASSGTGRRRPDRADKLIERMRGSAGPGMSTDEIMELTRHYSDDPLLR